MMKDTEETSPIKENLFEYIKNSQKIPQLMSEEKYDEVITEVTESCYDMALSAGGKDEGIGILATGLLHYLLTNAMINSQRKVQFHGIELDIVVPDVRTLEKDAKKPSSYAFPNHQTQRSSKKKFHT